MIFDKIILKNYFNIDTLEVSNITNINVFIGKNGCGKTTILNSILCNADSSDEGTVRLEYKGQQVILPKDEIVDSGIKCVDVKQKTEFLKYLKLYKHGGNYKIEDVRYTENGWDFIKNCNGINQSVPHDQCYVENGLYKYSLLIHNIMIRNKPCVTIESIERALHFINLKLILKLIAEHCKRNDTQVFITTHSKEVLELLTQVSFEVDYNRMAVFNLCRSRKNNILRCYRYDIDGLENLLETNTELRD